MMTPGRWATGMGSPLRALMACPLAAA
jgi:hypothetical protein